MGDFCVNIQGVPDDLLEFLGYRVISEDKEFRLFEDLNGDPHIVQKENPILRVDDYNDANHLANRAEKAVIFNAPPKSK